MRAYETLQKLIKEEKWNIASTYNGDPKYNELLKYINTIKPVGFFEGMHAHIRKVALIDEEAFQLLWDNYLIGLRNNDTKEEFIVITTGYYRDLYEIIANTCGNKKNITIEKNLTKRWNKNYEIITNFLKSNFIQVLGSDYSKYINYEDDFYTVAYLCGAINGVGITSYDNSLPHEIMDKEEIKFKEFLKDLFYDNSNVKKFLKTAEYYDEVDYIMGENDGADWSCDFLTCYEKGFEGGGPIKLNSYLKTTYKK